MSTGAVVSSAVSQQSSRCLDVPFFLPLERLLDWLSGLVAARQARFTDCVGETGAGRFRERGEVECAGGSVPTLSVLVLSPIICINRGERLALVPLGLGVGLLS